MNLKTFLFLSIDNMVGIVMAEDVQHAADLLEKAGKHFAMLWEVKEEPHVEIIGKVR